MAWFSVTKGRINADGTRTLLGDSATPPAPPVPVVPGAPPSTTAALSNATDTAKTAAERQRKRARAGTALLRGPAGSGTAPTANLQPKTLLGY